MGNITYFVTKSYVNTEIESETNARSTNDDTINTRITNLENTKLSITSQIAGLNSGISTLKSQTDARIGNDPLNAFIEFPSTYQGARADGSTFALTKARNIREGLNAISAILKDHISTFDVATLNNVATLNTQIDNYITDYDAQVARIDAILALAPMETIDGVEETVDTFAEVVKLINQLKNNASNNASFETYQTNITSLINAKADLLQDINTKTRYIDATTGTKYKMYITGGQLAIEDVLE